MGGRLGRAVATIEFGGAGASIEEVLGAFELVCSAAGRRGTQPVAEARSGSAPPAGVDQPKLARMA
ncbi:MAG: hypothetical protein M3P85_16745 [Actinomycetota bacterium]|nr:hypothetical protein [Actinomycetota bacterium]